MEKLRNFFRTKPTVTVQEQHEDEFSEDEEQLPSVDDDDSESRDEPTETELAPPETELAPPETELAPPETELAPPEIEPAPPETELAPPETEPAPPETEIAPRETKTPPETQKPKREKKKLKIRKCRPASSLQPKRDGGWAWVVVMAGFFIVFVVDGICFSFGVLYTELLDRFEGNRAETSLVGALLTGLYVCTAPLPNLLAKKFGYRPVAIIGCIIASAAFLVGSFSENIGTLIICIGVCGGIGFSFLYLTSMATVSLWFDIERPLAYGLASSGSGIGMLIIPLLVDDFRDIGWNGILRLEAGLLLSCVLACIAFRALPKEESNPEMRLLVQQTRHLSDAEFLKEVKREFSIKDINENEIKNKGEDFREDMWDDISHNGVLTTESYVRINTGQTKGETGFTNRGYEKEASDIMPDNLINSAVYRVKGTRFSIGSDQPMRPLQMVPDDIMEITPQSKSVLCNEINKPRMKTVPENAIISAGPTFVPAVTGENGRPTIRNYIPVKDSPLFSHRRRSSSSIHSESDTSSSDFTSSVSYSQDYYVSQSHGYVVIDFSTEYEQKHGLFGLQSEPPLDYILLENIYEKEMSSGDDASREVSFHTEIASDPTEERDSGSSDEQSGPAPSGRSRDEEVTSIARPPARNGEQETGDEIRVENLPPVSEDFGEEEHESELSEGGEGTLEASGPSANRDSNEEQPQSGTVIVQVHTEENPGGEQSPPAGAQNETMETLSDIQGVDQKEGADCHTSQPQALEPSIQIVDSKSDLDVGTGDHQSGPTNEPAGEASKEETTLSANNESEPKEDCKIEDLNGGSSDLTVETEDSGSSPPSEPTGEALQEETSEPVNIESEPKEDAESHIEDLNDGNSDLVGKKDHQLGQHSDSASNSLVNNELESTEDTQVTQSGKVETTLGSSLCIEQSKTEPDSVRESPVVEGKEATPSADALTVNETYVDTHVEDNQLDGKMQEAVDERSPGDTRTIENTQNTEEGLGDKGTVVTPSEDTPATLAMDELSPKTSRKSSRSVSFATPICTNGGITISLGAINDFYRRKSYTSYEVSGHDSNGQRGAVKGALKNSFDFAVFRRKLFIFLTIHSFLAPLGWYTVLLFLPDFAQGQNLGEGRASFLISIVGISVVVFRVLSGCLVYFFPDHVKPLFVWGVVSLLVACVTWALPDMTSYGELTFAAIMCGMLLAADVALRTVIIEEALGTEHLTAGFTYNCLVSGVAIILAGPLNGALYDINDTYESPFHFAASAMFFAAVTNTVAIIVTRFWPDTTRPVERTVRGRGSEAVWVHASVLKTIQGHQLARRRKTNVSELITWQDHHLREHSDVKEKSEHEGIATTPSIPPGSEKGYQYQEPDAAPTSGSTHAPVMITIEDVDVENNY